MNANVFKIKLMEEHRKAKSRKRTRGVRAGTDAGRTWATEDHGRRLIFCTRNRTGPISGFAKNGDAPEDEPTFSAHLRPFAFICGKKGNIE